MAMTVTGYTSTANDRFSSGYPGAPVENGSSGFVGAGLDWGGVGWSADLATKSFGFLSPQHYLVARHFSGATNLRIFADGSVQTYAQSTVEATGLGVVFAGQTLGDISVGTLASPIPASGGMPRYAVLDLNSASATNSPAAYMGLDLLLYGRGPNVSSSTRVGAASINSVTISGNNHYFTTSRSNVQLEGGDSGSPATHRWTNPNGGEEITLVGNHAAISIPDNLNFINFLGTAEVMAKLNEFMNNDGFALRVAGDPTNTWVGASNTDITNRISWGLPIFSSAPSDRFVAFDAATAGGGLAVNVDANHNLRGLYFRSTAGSGDGFNFDGDGVLTVGRGGITNYDNSRQVFENDILLGNAQYWDGGSGGITVHDINTNGKLLEITGSGINRVDGVISGTGGIAVSGGILEVANSNTYGGATWVHAGELIANNTSGSATGTGVLKVAAGATLSGSGFINSSTQISGSVAPGNSIGTLTFNNDVVWNGGDDWEFELGTASVSLADAILGTSTQDLIVIAGGGDLTKGTGSTWTFDFANSGALGWYKLIDWDGTSNFTESDFTATNLAIGTGLFHIDGASSALYLRIIPEPATAILLGMAMLVPLRRRR